MSAGALTAATSPAVAAPPINTGRITFDTLSLGTTVVSQYQSYGVRFSSLLRVFVTSDGSQPTSPVLSGSPQFVGPIDFSIVDPVTGLPETTDGFTVDVGYIDNRNSVEISYFDRFGDRIGSVRANAFGINRIVVPVRNIARVSIQATETEAAGFSIDNLDIGTVLPGVAPRRMVSLGDSYTSGEGLLGENGRRYDCGTDMKKGEYYENTTYLAYGFTPWADQCDTVTGGRLTSGFLDRPRRTYENGCHRHGGAWPVLVREAMGIAGQNHLFVACSGAVTANVGFVSSTVTPDAQHDFPGSPNGVAGGQVQRTDARVFRNSGALPVDLVTIGIGGNDAGFADLIEACLRPSCLDDPDFGPSAIARVNQTVYPRLVETFQKVRSDFPAAAVLAYGYPLMLDVDLTCVGLFTVDINERRWFINEFIPSLNSAVADAAAAAGVTYMALDDVMTGHEICTEVPWVNGIRLGDDIGILAIKVFGKESFHPNERGHAEIAKYFKENYVDGLGRLTFSNPAPRTNIRPASQPVRLNVGHVSLDAEGRCGASCIQPACSVDRCGLGVQLSNFSPNTELTVVLNSDPIELGKVTTDSAGNAELSAEVPPEVTGVHTVTVSGVSPGGVRQQGSFEVNLARMQLPPGGMPMVPLQPARLLETRVGELTVDGLFQGEGRVAAGSEIELVVTGRGGVPAEADAVMLNVTAVGPDAPGFLVAYPCGTGRPTASNVNYQPGDVVPNAVFAKVGAGGKVCIFSLATTDIVVDVNGYIASSP